MRLHVDSSILPEREVQERWWRSSNEKSKNYDTPSSSSLYAVLPYVRTRYFFCFISMPLHPLSRFTSSTVIHIRHMRECRPWYLMLLSWHGSNRQALWLGSKICFSFGLQSIVHASRPYLPCLRCHHSARMFQSCTWQSKIEIITSSGADTVLKT